MDVVVAAHICLDMFPDLGALAPGALESHGRLFQIGRLRVTTGGLTANVGVALHRLGAKVRLLTTVGDDLVGESTLEALRRVSPSLVQYIRVRELTDSSYTFVLARPGDDRLFLHCTGPNADFTIDELDYELVKGARWFHFGYPPLLPHTFADDGRMLLEIMKGAKATGCVTSLDFTLPDPATASGQANWPLILQRVLPEVDVFVPSLEEAVFLLHRDLYIKWDGKVTTHVSRDLLDRMAKDLLAMGPAIVGIKLSDQGVILYGAAHERLSSISRQIPNAQQWADQVIGQPAFAVRVNGTTGAGDAAYSGLILALQEGLDPASAAREFCAVGAAAVEAPDGINGLPHASTLRSRFTVDYPVIRSALLHGS
ncbi:MAG: PfkB family carbohydrate kinase [Anaerolineae bacterium]